MTDLDETTKAILKRFRFDQAVFEKMRVALLGAASAPGAERLSGSVTCPAAADLVELPPRDTEDGKALSAIGQAALARGEVGMVVLAGGMATRFGGVVKAVVEVVPGSSFLRLKLADIQSVASAAACTIPIFLMTSFATSDEIRRVMREVIHPKTPIEILEQSVTMRLTSTGDMFHDALGRP